MRWFPSFDNKLNLYWEQYNQIMSDSIFWVVCGKWNSYFIWQSTKIIREGHWRRQRTFETLPLNWNSYKEFIPQDRDVWTGV